jgi:hypothetical protein
MIKRTQNKIAESRFSLPVVVTYGLLVCLAAGLVSSQGILQLLMLVVASLMMVVLNNSNSLIRIYSRMVSCSFMMMVTMSSFLLHELSTSIVQMSFIAFFLFYFRAYQRKDDAGEVFYAFAAMGLGSLVFVKVLWFLPIMIILLGTNVLALSGRTLCAALLGITLPYWFVGIWSLMQGTPWDWLGHFSGLKPSFPLFHLCILDSHRAITLGVVAVLSLTGIVHFLRNSYRDKIRIRMIYETFIVVDLFLLLFILMQPQHFDPLLSMLIVTTSPLIGHYIALTHTKVTNISFFVILAVVLLTTVFNLWMPSLNF